MLSKKPDKSDHERLKDIEHSISVLSLLVISCDILLLSLFFCVWHLETRIAQLSTIWVDYAAAGEELFDKIIMALHLIFNSL